jgi:hypothetical protein
MKHVQWIVNMQNSTCHQQYIRCHYNVQYSSFIPIKYHYFKHNLRSYWGIWHIGTSLNNSNAAEIRLLHFKPFKSSHIRFLIIVKSASLQVSPEAVTKGRSFQQNACTNSCLTHAVSGCILLLKDHPLWQIVFGPPCKWQLAGGQFHSNEEVEMAADEGFQIQESNFWHNWIV